MEFTCIGMIVNTHGIDGTVKVYPYTDDLSRFKKLKSCYIGDSKEKLLACSAKDNKGMILLKFENYNNINDILRFKDKYLYVSDDDRVHLKENQYFIYDLKQCEVYDTDGNFIGPVVDVYAGYANDAYVVEYNGKQIMIPCVKQFVKCVDINNKKIVVSLIEGMLE